MGTEKKGENKTEATKRKNEKKNIASVDGGHEKAKHKKK
jgi:hypothetical protein